MSKLWLTYAWKDNEDDDVDHIISELKSAGIEVGYDRVHLIPGRRLWDQIDRAIRDPDVLAWAIYVTENSLKSEPCQEELAYALDRALRTRGSSFPLIGLFPGNLDREIVPSALATRLYVNLRNNDWLQQVTDGLSGVRSGQAATPLPFGHKLHKVEKGYCLEVWPRTGTWSPTYAIVPEGDAEKLTALTAGPRGILDGMRMLVCGEGTQNGVFGRVINNPIDSATTGQIMLSSLPSWVEFGPAHGPRHTMKFQTTSDLNLGSHGFSA